jgi:hypothetical protein
MRDPAKVTNHAGRFAGSIKKALCFNAGKTKSDFPAKAVF